MDLESLAFVTEASLPFELEVPESFDQRIAERFLRLAQRLEFISPDDAEAIDRALDRTDFILLWRLQEDCSERWRQRLTRVRGKQLFRVDKHRVRLEGSFYVEAGFRNEEDSEQLDERNRNAFAALSERLGSFERAYVFGTGPSADLYSRLDFADGLTIVCNTIVKDRDLMDHVRPEILCFADPIFHFGCSRYAARFRDEVRIATDRHDFTICIPRKYFSLFIDLLPELESRTIGIPVRKDRSINLDLSETFELRSVDNVLTFLLLPIASTLAREIHVIGCDGRPLEEDQYFWNHNPKTQFGDLMDNIQSVHPGFFDLDYNDYYLRHCRNTERWMRAGERNGRRYFSMVDSLVPALRRRGPAQAALEQALESSKGDFRVMSVNPDLVSSFGHYLHHDLRCRAEVGERGGGFVSLANLGVHGTKETGIVPWFESHSWSVSGDCEIADGFGRELTAALATLEEADSENLTVLTMYLADHRHIVPVLEAIGKRRPRRAVFVLNLFYAHFVVFGDKQHLLGELEACLRSTRHLRRELGVHLCADSPMLRDALEDLCEESLRLWPMFSTTDYSSEHLAEASTAPRSRERQPIVAYYPSNLQTSKGYDLLAEAVEKMGERGQVNDLRFVVRELYQPTTPPSMRQVADQLRPWVEIVDGILSPDAYRRRMIESDIVLVPYRRDAFRSRTSGVISDAILLGKPVVTTAGTWGGEQVMRFGNGATFEDGDVEGFIKALSEVKTHYRRYVTQAQRAREPWLREHSPAAFVAMVREVASEAPERVSESRRASLLAEIEAAKKSLGMQSRPATLRRRLRKLELPGVLRRAWVLSDRLAHRLIWRAKGWVERNPAIDARLRRYLWRFENRGLGLKLRREGFSLRDYLVRRGSQRPGAGA